MENHDGLCYFLSNPENDQEECLGNFKLSSGAVVCLYIGYNEDCTSIILSFVDNIDVETVLYETEYLNNGDYDENMQNISSNFSKNLEDLHNNIFVCMHCKTTFSCISENVDSYGFKNKLLCSNCGLQNIYDKQFSDETCAICLEAIGFGEVDLICDDNKHKLHLCCGKKLNQCPLCRKQREVPQQTETTFTYTLS